MPTTTIDVAASSVPPVVAPLHPAFRHKDFSICAKFPLRKDTYKPSRCLIESESCMLGNWHVQFDEG